MIDDLDVLNDLDQLQSRYDVLRQLGHDGEFIVYAVRSPLTDRHFAVSVMGDTASRGSRGNPGTLQLWQAHTVEPLIHPKLMVLHAVHYLQGGAVALAMDRRRGTTLAERLVDSGPLSVDEAERILRDVAEALAYLHSRGVVHRGSRPESIFLDRDSGHARLAHFSIDSAAEQSIIRKFTYLAPEQIDGCTRVDGRRLSHRTDLYSLALVGYTMLLGRQPWEATSLAGLMEMRKQALLPPLLESRPDVPDYLRRALEGCLHRNPRKRWRGVEEFLGQLDPAASITPAGGGIDWEAIPARFLMYAAAWQRAVRRRPATRLLRTLAPVAAAGVVALVGLNLLGGERNATPPGTSEPVRSGTAALEKAVVEIIPAEEIATVGPAETQMPDFPGRSIMHAPETDQPSAVPRPVPAPAGDRSTPPRDARPFSSPRAASGGLVLLGDPIDD